MRELPPTLAVNRAVAEFRLGRPLLVLDRDGASIAAATELAGAEAVAIIEAAADQPPTLALTENRGRALNILPTGGSVILVEPGSWLKLDVLRSLADATTDLEMPLRGPFKRQRRAPNAREIAAVQLAKHARLLPSVIVGNLADAETEAMRERHDLLSVAADAVIAYESDAAISLSPVSAARVPLAEAENTRILAFRPADGGVEHLAIVIGDAAPDEPVLVRLHSECFTGDLLASLKCDCGDQLRAAVKAIEQAGAGILLYLAQEGRGIGLMNKLRAYRLQQDGFDTVEANLRLGFDADERVFRPAAQILDLLGYNRVRLMTNNPDKVDGLRQCGIDVVERVAHAFPANRHNEFYLATKKSRSGHLF